MSANRFTLDANVLFYAVDANAGAKRQTALAILERAPSQDCVLTVQALAEFFAAATRKLPVAADEIATYVRDWMTLFPVVMASPEALAMAVIDAERRRLSVWDALLVATAFHAGCTCVLTEDMQDGARHNGVLIRDPFVGPGIPPDIRRLLGMA